MLLGVSQRLGSALRQSLLAANTSRIAAVRCMSGHKITDDELEARYESYYNRPDIDGWEIRKAMNDMHGLDMVPEPATIIAALRGCRRLNDYALATRYLEAIKNKCGNRVKEIYPYILQEIRPVLDELGLSTPEELGYDKPELYLEDVDDL